VYQNRYSGHVTGQPGRPVGITALSTRYEASRKVHPISWRYQTWSVSEINICVSGLCVAQKSTNVNFSAPTTLSNEEIKALRCAILVNVIISPKLICSYDLNHSALFLHPILWIKYFAIH
jgi:hypothetical protein